VSAVELLNQINVVSVTVVVFLLVIVIVLEEYSIVWENVEEKLA
jgi:hypothetical protein